MFQCYDSSQMVLKDRAGSNSGVKNLKRIQIKFVPCFEEFPDDPTCNDIN